VDELTLPAVREIDGQLQGFSTLTTARGQKTDKHHHRFIILYFLLYYLIRTIEFNAASLRIVLLCRNVSCETQAHIGEFCIVDAAVKGLAAVMP